jgi:hypothetical protein
MISFLNWSFFYPASNLINEDGQLNYQALVRAILVALNERPSQRICDVALSLLDVLLDLILDVRPVLPNDSSPAPNPLPQTPMATSSSNLPPLPSLDGTIYRLLLSCITRLVGRGFDSLTKSFIAASIFVHLFPKKSIINDKSNEFYSYT